MTAKKAPELFSTILFPAGGHEALPNPVNPYFVIGGRQRYLHKNLHFGRVLVPVEKIDNLPDLDEKWRAFAWFDIPRIPAAMIGQAWSFFRSIHNTRKSEAMVDIYYHHEHGYRFFIPPQIASGGGVRCVRNPEHIEVGWRLVGTLHSHCDMGAFHSGTDTHDADSHDGIHFTIGHVTSNPCQIAVMASANGIRWDLKIDEVVEGEISFQLHPKWWERYHEHPIAKDHFALATTPKSHVSKWGGKSGAWRDDDDDEGRGYGRYGYSGAWPFDHDKDPKDNTIPSLWASHKRLDTLGTRMAAHEKLDLVDEAQLSYILDSISEDIYRIDEELRDLGIRVEMEFRHAPHLRKRKIAEQIGFDPDRAHTPNGNDDDEIVGQITAGI